MEPQRGVKIHIAMKNYNELKSILGKYRVQYKEIAKRGGMGLQRVKQLMSILHLSGPGDPPDWLIAAVRELLQERGASGAEIEQAIRELIIGNIEKESDESVKSKD